MATDGDLGSLCFPGFFVSFPSFSGGFGLLGFFYPGVTGSLGGGFVFQC